MKGTLIALGFALAVSPPAPAPNFSGDWVLASATASGAGRSSAGAVQTTEEKPTTSYISGAAFNCGRECRLVHDAKTLTVENALLGSATAPPVTLQLDGSQMALSNSRGLQLSATATWNADKLEIVSKPKQLPIGHKQLLSLDGTQLVVMTSDDQGMSRVTLKYRKK